jgi:hypothetical protein
MIHFNLKVVPRNIVNVIKQLLIKMEILQKPEQLVLNMIIKLFYKIFVFNNAAIPLTIINLQMLHFSNAQLQINNFISYLLT